MDTCDSYAPPRAALEHDGVEQNPKYDFDRAFDSHVCLHKDNAGAGPIANCMFLQNQQQCPLYSTGKASEILGKANTEETILILRSHLTRFNIRTYSVLEVGDGKHEILYTLDEHQSDQSHAMVSDFFDDLVKERDAIVVEVPPEDSGPESYLEKVVSV